MQVNCPTARNDYIICKATASVKSNEYFYHRTLPLLRYNNNIIFLVPRHYSCMVCVVTIAGNLLAFFQGGGDYTWYFTASLIDQQGLCPETPNILYYLELKKKLTTIIIFKQFMLYYINKSLFFCLFNQREIQ